MKLVRFLFFLASMTLFTLACGAGDLSPAFSAITLTKIPTVMPTMTPLSTHTPIPTPAYATPMLQALPFPSWVADFSDPILVTLDGRQPDFQDDFTYPNLGWFYFGSGIHRRPFYAHIQDGTLLIKLPEENENKDSWVYNPKLIRRNFVLSFDFQFEETQPNDMVRFQFDQTADQSVTLDLFKNQTWMLHWGSHNDQRSTTGSFDYFAPERIPILIIMQGGECAIYLTDVPLTYLNNCRTGPTVRSAPWAVTFHMLADPGHIAAVTIDNLKLWDLDKITKLARPQLRRLRSRE